MVARRTTLRLNGAQLKIASDWPSGGIDWYLTYGGFPNSNLTSNRIVRMTANGFPAFGGYLWTVEYRPTTPTGGASDGPYLVKYDTDARQELFATLLPTGQFAPALGQFTTSTISSQINQGTSAELSGVSQDSVISYLTASGLHLWDNDGNHTFTPTTTETATTVDNFAGESAFPEGGTAFYAYKKTKTRKAECVAWRHVPKGAGTEHTVFNLTSGVIYPPVTVANEAKILVGDLSVSDSVLSVGGSGIEATDQGVLGHIRSVSGGGQIDYSLVRPPVTTFTLSAFDSSPYAWAALIQRDYTQGVIESAPGTYALSGPSYSKTQLVINGTVVWSHTAGENFTTGDITGLRGLHVCHPHETLGDGWVAVTAAINEPYAEAGVNPSTQVFRIVVFKDGGEVWRSPQMRATGNSFQPPTISNSGDRWLYATYPETNSDPTYIPYDHFRHDGSAMWKSGQLNAAGTDTIPDPHLFSQQAFRYFPFSKSQAVVQNSSALGNGLPAEWPPNI